VRVKQGHAGRDGHDVFGLEKFWAPRLFHDLTRDRNQRD
jgi:hypothetical protein